MKSVALTMLAAAALTLGACKDKASDLQNNVEKVGADIKDRVGNDKDVKEAGQALKKATKDGGKGIRKVVAAAKDSADNKKTNKPG
jgi:hypothetical protein